MANGRKEQDSAGAKEYGQVIAKAWADPAFKKKLLANPAAVLEEHGIQRPAGVPAGARLKVVENTDQVAYFVLPVKPSEAELSDEELSRVAGGAGSWKDWLCSTQGCW